MFKKTTRRDFLLAAGAAIVLPACSREKFSADMISKVTSDLPFELFRVSGMHALQAWEEMSQRYAGTAAAVVLGPEEELEYLRGSWAMDSFGSPESILAKTGDIDFPSGFRAHLRTQMEEMLDQFKDDPQWQSLFENVGEFGLAEDLPTGDWPDGPIDPANELGLSLATSWETGQPHDEVLIGVFPTADWTEIPAYLPFGGWNACPLPEWHVEALRYWRDKWGARLVGLGHDTMNLRVQTKPKSRDEAIELAMEQYDYCADIVDQGVGDIATLAHQLMASDWWYFWWD